MSFARKLHDLRLAKRLSLQDVATAVGISKAHVFNLEKGITANPSMELVVKLEKEFGIKISSSEQSKEALSSVSGLAAFIRAHQASPRA